MLCQLDTFGIIVMQLRVIGNRRPMLGWCTIAMVRCLLRENNWSWICSFCHRFSIDAVTCSFRVSATQPYYYSVRRHRYPSWLICTHRWCWHLRPVLVERRYGFLVLILACGQRFHVFQIDIEMQLHSRPFRVWGAPIISLHFLHIFFRPRGILTYRDLHWYYLS